MISYTVFELLERQRLFTTLPCSARIFGHRSNTGLALDNISLPIVRMVIQVREVFVPEPTSARLILTKIRGSYVVFDNIPEMIQIVERLGSIGFD